MGTGGVPYQESYASPTADDVDSDGDLDLYFTSVYPIASGGVANWPRLFLNQGNFNFVDVTGAWGLPVGVPFGSSYAAFVPSGLNGLNPMLPTSNIEGLAFSPDGSTLFVGSLGSGPNPAANAIYRFDPDTGMPLDGVDDNGTIIQYIRDISATTSQGGPGTGDPMSPQRIVVLPPCVACPELDGDYDGDEIVGGGDYLKWQRDFGSQIEPGAGADGNGDGTVNAADYTIWRNNFGATAGSAAQIVPEPWALTLVFVATALFMTTNRRHFNWGRATTLDVLC